MAVIILSIGLLIFLAHLFSALFEKTKIPDVLPLVFLGLVLGPLLGIIRPEAFGRVGDVFTTVALVFILFQSGLHLNFSVLRESMMPGLRLTTINFIFTSAAVALLAKFLSGLTFMEGLMLGAILGGTSSAVVIPMVGRLPLDPRTRTTLILESTFSDVLCIVVTLGLLQGLKYDELRPGLMIGQILASFLLAAVIGGAGAVFWSSILDKVRQLENNIFTTVAFIFIIFGVAEFLGYSGAIASLAFGVILGNANGLRLPLPGKLAFLRPINLNDTEKAVFAEAVFLLKTFFFIYIGLSIRLSDPVLVLGGLGLAAAAFILRIPVAYLSLEKSLPKFDISIASVMVPKGLAAAVLASLPLQAGLKAGSTVQDVVYAVVLFSIMASAGLTFMIEKGYLEKWTTYLFSFYAARSRPVQ